MSISDGSIEYEVRTMPSTNDLNISNFAHTFLDDTSANEVRNTLDLASKNELGYRQKNTNYSVGDITYHNTLPTGWYLECTTAGTSGSNDLTINSPSIGGTVTDGTVVWMINTSFHATGGVIYKSLISRNKDNVALRITGGIDLNSANLQLNGGQNPTDTGYFRLFACDAINGLQTVLKGQPNGMLFWNDNDLAGSAIVAKSLGANGYIEYASRLIIQWGFAQSALGSKTVDVTFPVSFINSYRMVGNRISNNTNDDPYIVNVYHQSKSEAIFYTNTTVPSVSNWSLHWFAIGY